MYCNTNVKLATPAYKNILEAIGNTPLVKLNKFPQKHGLKCQVYAKCEFTNPGGSIKDRIAYSMMTHAEKEGKAHKGTRFVEPTSGNTGIGLAMTAVVKNLDGKDYKTTIVSPDKNSNEKLDTLRLLGADIVQILPTDDEREVANKIVQEDPLNNIELDQFSNEVNAETHFEITAREILVAMDKRVDMAVLGVGTGGTITGLSRYFKDPKHNDVDCTIVGVDPVGSLIWGQEKEPFYVEGIGGDFVPKVLDKKYVDVVVRTKDKESFNMARDLIQTEGILCGGSSGAALAALVIAARQLDKDKNVVVIIPDGIRNYMSKFVCDQWMEAHLFKEPPKRTFRWYNQLVNLEPNPPHGTLAPLVVPTIAGTGTCKAAIDLMGSKYDVVIVVGTTGEEGIYKGVISKNLLRSAATNREDELKPDEPISRHLIHDCPKLITNDPMNPPIVGLVSRTMDIAPFVVVLQRVSEHPEIFKPLGIITSEMVCDYIFQYKGKY